MQYQCHSELENSTSVDFFDILNQHGGKASIDDLFTIETENGKIVSIKPENSPSINRKYAGELTNTFYKRKNVGKTNQIEIDGFSNIN